MDCEFCGKSFASVSSLNWHIKTNKKCLEGRGLKSSFLCEICGKTYTVKASLDKHIQTGVCQKSQKRNNLIDIQVTKEEYDMIMRRREISPETLNTINVEELGLSILYSTKPEDCRDAKTLGLFMKRMIQGKILFTQDKAVFRTDAGPHEMNPVLAIRTLLRHVFDAITDYLSRSDIDYLMDMRFILKFIKEDYNWHERNKSKLSIDAGRRYFRAKELLETILQKLVE